MCTGKYALNSPEAEYYRFLGECAALLLQKKTLQETAAEKGLTVEELLEKLEDIKEMNPYLYQQLQEVANNL